MTAMQIITTRADLRNWVWEYAGKAGEREIDDITNYIQNDSARPAWGTDWSDYFETLPENLFELLDEDNSDSNE